MLVITDGMVSNFNKTGIGYVPSGYLSVLENKGSFSMLEIPFGFRGNIYETIGSHHTDISFYYQTMHHVPLVGGYMSMIDKGVWEYFYKDTLIQKLALCQKYNKCIPLTDDETKRFTSVYRIRYVTILNSKYSYMKKYLGDSINLIKIYEDELVTVWLNSHESLAR